MAHNTLRTFHLFAGAGGGILADLLLGHLPIGACEIEEYPRRVLLQRQRDGILPNFPIWDDIRTLDGKPWRGLIDELYAGFPCQDLSIANPNGKGLDGERSGLWDETLRFIREARPLNVNLENSWRLISNGIGRVIRQLSEIGYVGSYTMLGGHETGSCANGLRTWIHATKTDSDRRETLQGVQVIKPCSPASLERQFSRAIGATWDEETDARVRRNPDALARGMDRLKAIGNGQDPIVAATAWMILNQ